MSAFAGVQGAGGSPSGGGAQAYNQKVLDEGGYLTPGGWVPVDKTAGVAAPPPTNDHWSYYGKDPLEAAKNRAAGQGPASEEVRAGWFSQPAPAPAPAPAAGSPAFVIGGTPTGTQPAPAPAAPAPSAPAAGQGQPANFMGQPGALSSWMTQATGGAQAPQSLNLTDDMLVSKQLTKLLATDNPLFERARAGALETANARGLINSTMGAQAGEAAMLDVALPIAQGDANRTFEAARGNVDTANTFARDANGALRQAALTALQGNVALERDLQLFDKQQGAQLYNGYRTANLAAIDAFNARVAAIQASDMDADVKTAQIELARQTLTDTTGWLSTLYRNSPNWVQEWASFTMEPA